MKGCEIRKNSPLLKKYIELYGQETGLTHYTEDLAFTKAVGATRGRVYSTQSMAMLKQKVVHYNNKYKRANSVTFKPDGPTSWKVDRVIINLQPVNLERRAERAAIRAEGDKTFSNIENKDELTTKLQQKLQELYPEISLEFGEIGDGILGQADIRAMSVLINSITQTNQVVPHEYAHHYIAWFRNSPIVQEAINKWGSEEKLVQAIGEQVVVQKGEAYTWWKQFTKWISDLFNKLSDKSKEELRDILTDAFLQRVNLDSGNTLTTKDIQLRLSDGTFNQEVTTENSKSKEALEGILDSIQNRYKAITHSRSSTNKESLLKAQKDLIDRLNKMYNEGLYLKGIQEWIDKASADYTLIYGAEEFTDSDGKVHPAVKGSLDSLKKRIGGSSALDIAVEANTIRNMGNFAASQEHVAEDIITSLTEALESGEFTTSELKAQAKQLIRQSDSIKLNAANMKRDYATLSTTLISKFLEPFGWNKTWEDLKEVLSKPATDISGTSLWLDSMANVRDEVLQLFAAAIVKQKNDAREEVLETEKQFIELKKKLENAGITDTTWMYNKLDGKQTGNYVTERDWDTYTDLRNKLYKEYETKVGKPYKEYSNLSTEQKLEYKRNLSKEDKDYLDAFNLKRNRFNSEYTESQLFIETLLEAKRKELSAEEYNQWFNLNVKFDEKNGFWTIPKKIDPKFAEIRSNPLKWEMYSKVVGEKIRLESSFPDKMRHPRRAPQLRKSSVERLVTGGMTNITDNLKEHFKVMEDESNRGRDFNITDEKGNLVNLIPIYYTKRLTQLEHLSTDAVSSMIEFSRMATDRKHMMEVVDALEIGKDVLFNRKVLKLDSKKNPIKILKKHGKTNTEDDVTEPTPGNIFKMYEGMIDMLVYGRVDKKLIVKGVDISKALDALGKYTAMTQLGLSVFAGIANILNGKAQLRIESASNEYYGYNDLLWADKAYATSLDGVLADIGARIPSGKLSLFNESMDILEDFNEKVRGLDADQKSKVARMFRTSTLFFISQAGEHYMHSKGALAVASQFRFDPETKHFLKKKDYFEPVDTIKRELKAEIKKQTAVDVLNGKSSKSVTKELEMAFKDRIDTKQKELSEKWDKLTNFWDAHEVVNNRLVVKEEFKSDSYESDKRMYMSLTKSLNQSLFGIYNENDRNLAQRSALLRLAIMFRKWLKPALDRRFQSKQFDARRGSDTEGYYATAGRFMAGVYKELIKGEHAVYRDWAILTDSEKANVKRVAAEVSYLIAALVLATILTTLAGDDGEDDWWLNLAAYQANRLVTELGAITPTPLLPTEALKLLKSPAAATQPLTELITFMQFWNWNEELSRGKYKGMTKFEKGVIRMVPLGKTIHDWSYPEDKMTYYMMFR